jgi:hypothetical protein
MLASLDSVIGREEVFVVLGSAVDSWHQCTIFIVRFLVAFNKVKGLCFKI